MSVFSLLALYEFDRVKCCVLNFSEPFIISKFYLLMVGCGERLKGSLKLFFWIIKLSIMNSFIAKCPTNHRQITVCLCLATGISQYHTQRRPIIVHLSIHYLLGYKFIPLCFPLFFFLLLTFSSDLRCAFSSHFFILFTFNKGSFPSLCFLSVGVLNFLQMLYNNMTLNDRLFERENITN